MRRTAHCRRCKKRQYFDEVIRLYFEEGLSGTEICKIIPIHNSNLYRWLDEYEGIKRSEGKKYRKNQARLMKKKPKAKRVSGVSAPMTATDPIHIPTAIPTSGTAPRSDNTSDFPFNGIVQESKAGNTGTQSGVTARTEANLEARIRELEKQLRDEKLKSALYNEMINVAEKQFNIPIRKKAGTRQ